MTAPATAAQPDRSAQPALYEYEHEPVRVVRRARRARRPVRMHGLDGLRALAVAAVVAFHGRLVPGGFVGVSLFLTLSGFLITVRSLERLDRGGSFRALEFTAARLRRLAPAALAGIAFGLATTWWLGGGDRLIDLRAQALWAATYTQNWHAAVGGGGGYAAMFDRPNPFEHYWSLAVEEQFYLAFPLLMFVIARWGRGRAAVVVALLAAGSIWLARFTDLSAARRYFGTDTRAWELLAGVLLGLAWDRLAPALRRGGVFTDVVRWASVAAVAVGVATIGVSSAWVTEGGFVVWPLVSVVLVATTAARPGRLLTAGPLGLIGVLAYGIYLVHWPLQIVVDERLPHLPAAVRVAIVAIVAVGLAALSFRCIEQPIRVSDTPPLALLRFASVALVAVVLVAAIPQIDTTEVVQLPDVEVGTPVMIGAPVAPPTIPAEPPPVQWAIIGDSAALTLSVTEAFTRGTPETARTFEGRRFVPREGDTIMGCAVARHGAQGNPKCNTRWDHFAKVAAQGPDVLVLFAPGHWELGSLKVDGRRTSLDDPAAVAWVRSEFEAALALLRSGGARVALVTTPPEGPGACRSLRSLGVRCDRAERTRRLGVLNGLLGDLARGLGVPLIDLGSWVGAHEPARLLPDGTHYTPATATQVWDRFLMAEVARADTVTRGLLPAGNARQTPNP